MEDKILGEIYIRDCNKVWFRNVLIQLMEWSIWHIRNVYEEKGEERDLWSYFKRKLSTIIVQRAHLLLGDDPIRVRLAAPLPVHFVDGFVRYYLWNYCNRWKSEFGEISVLLFVFVWEMVFNNSVVILKKKIGRLRCQAIVVQCHSRPSTNSKGGHRTNWGDIGKKAASNWGSRNEKISSRNAEMSLWTPTIWAKSTRTLLNPCRSLASGVQQILWNVSNAHLSHFSWW